MRYIFLLGLLIGCEPATITTGSLPLNGANEPNDADQGCEFCDSGLKWDRAVGDEDGAVTDGTVADGTVADIGGAESCGDGVCNEGETCGSCEQDCDACPPMCGDGACNGNETCGSCEQDCDACPPMCGDGACNGNETCNDCAQDCGECGWPPDLARSEEDLLVMVNEQRAIGANCGGAEMPPVAPVMMNAELRQASRLHSQDMGQNNYFSHTGLDGSNFAQRAGRAGFRGQPGGENIAAGNGPAAAAFQQWLTSPGHCQNMMSGRFSLIGVGHALVPGSQYGHYWTQVFGN